MKSTSAGKENSRPRFRTRAAAQQKPSVPPAGPIDQPAAVEPRVTRFSASLPKRRKSNPSDIDRALLDSRRNSRVSVGQPRGKLTNPNSNGKHNLGKRAAKDFERSGELSNELKKSFQENEEIGATLEGNAGGDDKEVNWSPIPMCSLGGEGKESRDLDNNGNALDELDGNYLENAKKKIRVGSCNSEKKDRALSSVSLRMPDQVNLSKGSEIKKFRSSGVGAQLWSRDNGTNEYSNKLREKLA